MRPDFPVVPLPEPSAAALRDADIVALLKSGDTQKAFALLLDRYKTKVFHLCVAMLGDIHQAQDTTQDSLLRVWRALPSYDSSRAAISTWIYAIARNRCLTELSQRRASVQSIENPAVLAEVEHIPLPAAANDVAALQLLTQLVESLPPMQQTSLKLYYFEERSITEVAQILELPEGTVKTHLHRARASLHRAMQVRGLASASLWL